MSIVWLKSASAWVAGLIRAALCCFLDRCVLQVSNLGKLKITSSEPVRLSEFNFALGTPMPTSTTPSNPNTPDTSPLIGAAPILAVVAGGLFLLSVAYVVKNFKKFSQNSSNKMVQRLLKEQVPENDIRQHRRDLTNLKYLVQKAEGLDSEKFQNNEFSMFSKIKSYIAHNVYEYADLNAVVDMLNVAINAQKSFAAIYQVESQFHSKSQQEFYDYVNNVLNREGLDRQELKKKVLRKAEIVCGELKTEEGRAAIATYASEVVKVSENDFGIELLRLFKKNHLSDYSIIGKIGESIDRLDGANLVDLDGLMLMVLEKSNAFEKIGAVLDLKEEANSPDTHRKVLQFIGLKKRYQASYAKFQDLLATVKEFHRYYQSITLIREKYPAKTYRIPVEFTIELPGLKLYKKYMAMQDNYQERPVDQLSALAAKAAEVNDDSKKLFKNGWDRAKLSGMAVLPK
jgi:hypothetical protein